MQRYLRDGEYQVAELVHYSAVVKRRRCCRIDAVIGRIDLVEVISVCQPFGGMDGLQVWDQQCCCRQTATRRCKFTTPGRPRTLETQMHCRLWATLNPEPTRM